MDKQGGLEAMGLEVWWPGSEAPALRVPSLSIRPGQLVVVCGGVASGKSTLLLGLLRELGGGGGGGGGQMGAAGPERPAVAYCPQTPAFIHDTIKVRYGDLRVLLVCLHGTGLAACHKWRLPAHVHPRHMPNAMPSPVTRDTPPALGPRRPTFCLVCPRTRPLCALRSRPRGWQRMWGACSRGWARWWLRRGPASQV